MALAVLLIVTLIFGVAAGAAATVASLGKRKRRGRAVRGCRRGEDGKWVVW